MLATPQLLPWYPEATSILDGKLTGSSGSSGASEAMSTRDNGFQTKPGTANGSWETIPPLSSCGWGGCCCWRLEMTVCFEAGCTVCASPGIPIAGCQGAGIPRCTLRRHICPPLRKREWGHSGLAGKLSSLKAVTVFPWARRGGLQTRGLENKRAVSGRIWRGETTCLGWVSVGDATFQGVRCWAESVACSRSVLGGSFVQQEVARRVLGAGNSPSFALVSGGADVNCRDDPSMGHSKDVGRVSHFPFPVSPSPSSDLE